jgi:hypothetical protein
MAMRLVPSIGKLGAEFAPVSDESELEIAIETPPGSNIDYTHLKS